MKEKGKQMLTRRKRELNTKANLKNKQENSMGAFRTSLEFRRYEDEKIRHVEQINLKRIELERDTDIYREKNHRLVEKVSIKYTHFLHG